MREPSRVNFGKLSSFDKTRNLVKPSCWRVLRTVDEISKFGNIGLSLEIAAYREVKSDANYHFRRGFRRVVDGGQCFGRLGPGSHVCGTVRSSL